MTRGSPASASASEPPFNRLRLLAFLSRPGPLFFVALAIRVAWIFTLPNELIWVDEKEFSEIAYSIVAGEGYVSSSYRANPVVPLYLASFLYVFGDSVLYPRLGQAVIGALSCLLLQRLGTLVAGSTVGVIASLLLAFYPGHIFLSGVFYVDCIAIFFATAWLLTTYRASRAEGGLGHAALAGFLFGLLALTRPTFLAIAPLGAVFFLVLPAPRIVQAMRAAVVFTIVCVLTIAPWTARNYQKYERIVVVAGGFWDTLWKGNNEVADGGPDDRHLGYDGELWRTRVAKLPDAERDAIFAKYAEVKRHVLEIRRGYHDHVLARDEILKPVTLDLIRNDPRRFATLFARKIVTLFNAFSATSDSTLRSASPLRVALSLYFYPLLALAGASVVLTARDWRHYAPFNLLVAGWAGLHGILTSCTRFRLPIDPFLFLLAAVAIVRLLALRPRPSA